MKVATLELPDLRESDLLAHLLTLTKSWDAAEIFAALSPFFIEPTKDDESRLSCIARCLVKRPKKIDPRWGGVMLDVATKTTDDDVRYCVVQLIEGLFDAAGKAVFPADAADRIFAAVDALDDGYRPWLDVWKQWKDPRIPALLVAKIEAWEDPSMAIDELRELPKKEVAALLSARLDRGPMKFAVARRAEAAQQQLNELLAKVGLAKKYAANDKGLLRDVVRSGDLAAVEDLLANGADPNENETGPETILMVALEGAYVTAAEKKGDDHIEIVRALLDAGAKPTAKLAYAWDFYDKRIKANATAVTLAKYMLAACTPPYGVEDGGVDVDGNQNFAYIPDAQRKKMRPRVARVAALLGVTAEPAKTAPAKKARRANA